MSDPTYNPATRRELARILWRQWVMSQPGGVDFLRREGARIRWRERQMGPETMTFEVPRE